MITGRRTPTSRTPSAKSRPPSGKVPSRPTSQTGSTSRPQSQTGSRSRPVTGSRSRVSSRPTTSGTRQGSADQRSWAITRHNTNGLSTIGFYEKVKLILTKPSQQRMMHELNTLEPWFRKKSKLFQKIKQETLLDVIKHCEFRTAEPDEVIIEQGFKGNEKNFYIVLRGKVSVLVKEEKLDDDDDEEKENNAIYNEMMEEEKMETDRTKLGTSVNTLSDGCTFGELALMNDDNNRSASIVSDGVTDLIVISRELYDRSVGKIIKEEYLAKLKFVEGNKLFKEWAQKWKRQLAVGLQRKKLSYDEVLLKQGEPSDYIYFISKGELKLVADPDLHNEHFPDFMRRTSRCFEEDIYKNSMNFRLQNYISPRSRQAKRLKSAAEEAKTDGTVQSLHHPENKLIMSPSDLRKRTARTRSQMHRKYNICYLEQGQLIGDVEFFTGLDRYHGSAVSTSQETIVFQLHYIQFNRYFRKKNPDTLAEMTKSLGMQMPRRIVLEHINKNVPLLRCVMLKLDDLNGTNHIKRRPRDDDDALSATGEDYESTIRSRSKSGVSSKTFTMSHKHGNQNDKFKDLGFQFPEMSEHAMTKYLNTQVNQVLQLDKDKEEKENVEPDPEVTEENEEGNKLVKGESGVYNMAKVTKKQEEKKEIPIMNPRNGIFFKVLQVSNPNIEKQHLAIEEEEFNYLCQIKRRITKDLHKFYPFASLESFLSLGDQDTKTGRLCRRSVHTAGVEDQNTIRRRKLPNITKPMKTSMKRVVKSAAPQRKNVGFALPD